MHCPVVQVICRYDRKTGITEHFKLITHKQLFIDAHNATCCTDLSKAVVLIDKSAPRDQQQRVQTDGQFVHHAALHHIGDYQETGTMSRC